MELEAKVKQLIKERTYKLGLSDEEITGDLKEIGLDSIDMVEVWSDIENEFNININENIFSSWQTVEDIIESLKDIL